MDMRSGVSRMMRPRSRRFSGARPMVKSGPWRGSRNVVAGLSVQTSLTRSRRPMAVVSLPSSVGSPRSAQRMDLRVTWVAATTRRRRGSSARLRGSNRAGAIRGRAADDP